MKLFSKKRTRPTIGLALGSGGAHGLVHIGIIKVLLDNNIPIDYIAGTSAGALVGGLYAAHKDIDAVERIALANNLSKIMHFMFDVTAHGGILSGNAIEQFVRTELDGLTFDKLKMPFAIVATDIKSGKAVIIQDGDVASAIRASISVPVVFKPVLYDEHILVDGGLVMPVPVELVRSMGADIVIGVNLDTPCPHGDHIGDLGLAEIATMSIEILRNNLSETQARTADITISPQFAKRGFVGWGEFLHAKELVDKGQDAMEAAMPELRALLSKQ